MKEEQRARMAELTENAKNDRAERREFERALLEELRRLNENIETLANRPASDGLVL
jgi:hypothetical protein